MKTGQTINVNMKSFSYFQLLMFCGLLTLLTIQPLVVQPLNASTLTCPAGDKLPTDVKIVSGKTAAQTQMDFEKSSWKTLRYMAQDGSDKDPLWTTWQSTVDFLKPKKVQGPHNRYYPQACVDAYPKDYKNYRVLAELSKVNDGFLEADSGGLSHNPVITANATFLRYEILLHNETSTWLATQFYDKKKNLKPITADVSFPCGPTNKQPVSLVIKNAWMEVPQKATKNSKAWTSKMSPAAKKLFTNDFNAIKNRTFYTEDLLVYTPAQRSSDGKESCEKKTMGLVAMHIARKTQTQPGWIWSTFEHVDNAPDCTSLPPRATGGIGDPGPARSCPRTVDKTYNFYGTLCNMGDSANPLSKKHPLEGLICMSCNQGPHPNGSVDSQNCLGAAGPNPNADRTGKAQAGWCIDQPPNQLGGLSMLCRQVPVSSNYQQAAQLNTACQKAVKGDIWKNYMLISTQWVTTGDSCTTQEADKLYHKLAHGGDVTPKGGDPYTVNIIATKDILPHVNIWPNDSKPYLGNTAIESYERSNCIGCHAKSDTDSDVNEKTGFNTDFMYFLALELKEAIAAQKGK